MYFFNRYKANIEKMGTNSGNHHISLLIGKKIEVNLRSKIRLRGILCGFDQFMNLVLKDSTLFCKKKKEKLGISLIRGQLVVSLELYNDC